MGAFRWGFIGWGGFWAWELLGQGDFLGCGLLVGGLLSEGLLEGPLIIDWFGMVKLGSWINPG